MQFTQVSNWNIPEGEVIRVTDSLNRVIWEKTQPVPPTPETTYFYVEDASGTANTLTIKRMYNDSPTVRVFYSTDQTNWNLLGNTSISGITTTIPANGKIYLKATENTWCTTETVTSGGLTRIYYYWNEIITADTYNVGGNIMSLIYGDNFINQTSFPNNSRYNFYGLFFSGGSIRNDKLVDASNLKLPATTLTYHCYQQMFDNCTSLTTPPNLPATTLSSGCYYDMFGGCTALTTAPALPATTLADYCYYSMFSGCTSLTTAPTLPATTLTNGCYENMFWGCTSLNSVTTYAQDISANSCIYNWLANVAAQGDFYNLGGATYVSGGSGIPSGWTVHTSL